LVALSLFLGLLSAQDYVGRLVVLHAVAGLALGAQRFLSVNHDWHVRLPTIGVDLRGLEVWCSTLVVDLSTALATKVIG